MKSSAISILFSLILCASSPAMADGPRTPPTGTPRQQADALIAETGHPELFDNQSDERELKVIHRASGLVCRFVAGDNANKLMVFSSPTIGDDVGCNTNIDDLGITVYATRYAANLTLKDVEAQAVGEIRGRWATATPFVGGVVMARTPPGFETAIDAFQIGAPPRLGYTHVRLARRGGWTFMQRLTAPKDLAPGLDMVIGSSRWTEVLTAVATHQDAE